MLRKHTLRTFLRSPNPWNPDKLIMSRFIHIKPAISGRISSPISTEIALTDLENQICTLLDDCTQHLREEKGLTTKCRIAGGWVRDKVSQSQEQSYLPLSFTPMLQLLGSQSNDIDIALEGMMGVSFAEHFAAFASSQDLPVGSVTKIQSNPGQSKHLETGRTTLLGVDLDFVNLRSEEYAEDSRIPTGIVSARFSRTDHTPVKMHSRRLVRHFKTPCGETSP